MEYERVEINKEQLEMDPYVSLGYGKMVFSPGACVALGGAETFKYVEIFKTRISKVCYFVFKFIKNKTKSCIKCSMDFVDSKPVIVIDDTKLIEALYGIEGVQPKETKRSLIKNDEMTNSFIVWNFYKENFMLSSGKRIRKKHIGTIINDEWLIVGSHSKPHPCYTLKNIHNSREIELSTRAVADIEKGLTNVNKILARREKGIKRSGIDAMVEKSKKYRELRKKRILKN